MNPNSGILSTNRVDVEFRRIERVRLSWCDGAIANIEKAGPADPALPCLIPGFVDAHVHVESGLLPPAEFARLALRHGTLACVADPHEIANVLGLEGVRFMLGNAAASPMPFCFGAPACVPATAFETAGARLGVEEIADLFDKDGLRLLSEVMNFPAALAGEAETLAKLDLARRRGLPVDGHAPGLRGEDARRYAACGISTDHECSSLEEAMDKLGAGMKILIREGSAARNFDALHPLIASHPRRVMLCSDDKHPDDLARGHIDRLAARAVATGHDPFDVLRCACLNPAEHYGLKLGRLRPGDGMDAVLVNNLREFAPLKAWLRGRLVMQRGQCLLGRVAAKPCNRFDAREAVAEDFKLPARADFIRVIEARDGTLLTDESILPPKVENGWLTADVDRDILWLAVLNRYRPAPPAVAFVRGFGLRQGALASSVAHDSHNVIAVGADLDSLLAAINAVVAMRGGLAVAAGESVWQLPLAIAGLMSLDDGDAVAARYADLQARAQALGSPLRSPFMTLSFMALLVIPELKLGDWGLFDGRAFRPTSLYV